MYAIREGNRHIHADMSVWIHRHACSFCLYLLVSSRHVVLWDVLQCICWSGNYARLIWCLIKTCCNCDAVLPCRYVQTVDFLKVGVPGSLLVYGVIVSLGYAIMMLVKY